MQSTDRKLTIADVSGPFREPREPVLSYDYSIQRSTWATPHGVRVKVSIPDELEVLRERLLGEATGSPGRQLMIRQILSRTIADWKVRIAESDGDRRGGLVRAIEMWLMLDSTPSTVRVRCGRRSQVVRRQEAAAETSTTLS